MAIEPALDARNYPDPAWSPYLVGAGIGVLSWLTFYFSDKPIGASSFYATVAGMLGKAVAPKHTEELDYYKSNPPKLNWEFAFVLAAIAGAAAAALTGGGFVNEWVPEMWRARFGDSLALRAAFAFGGGVLMAFGARLAGGCTSGHGISGTLQLNVASWIAVICFFIGGAVVANLMFRI
ncbi:YeeE/YedE family protein [Bradyrhizobium sp. 190]|nr:YeeE/YedE family protein [Bradyrhizobium sp. 190]